MTPLPPGWTETTLGVAARWGSGGTPRAGDARYYGGEIPWAVIGDLNDAVVSETARSITDEGLAASSARVVPAGTVLIAMYGSIGKLGIAGVDMATNQAIAFAEPLPAVDVRYLFWYLRSQRERLGAAGKGATQKNISQTVLRAWPLPLPPLNEQRRIVAAIEEHLSRVDAADSSMAAASARLGALREAELQAALAGSWPMQTIGELAHSVRNGLFVSRPAPSPPGVPIFRISAVRPMSLDVEDVRYADVAATAAEPYLTTEGDLLFTRYSGNPEYVGACARVPHMTERVLHPDKLIRVVVDRDRVEPAFVELACSAGVTRDEIRARRKTTAGQVGIAGGQLRTVPLPVPPLDVQREMVARVEEQLSAIDALRATIDRDRRRSRSLRRAILERAFRGELVRQDPTDEPASILLERIRAERAGTPPRPRRRVSA